MRKTQKTNDLIRSISKQQLAWATEQYRIFKNPLDAWQAIFMALTADVNLPIEIREYLRRVARSLSNPKADPRRAIARHVLQALELRTRGGPSYFVQRKNRDKRRSILLRAQLLAAPYPGEKVAPSASFEDALYRSATDAGMDPDSIKRQGRRLRTKRL